MRCMYCKIYACRGVCTGGDAGKLKAEIDEEVKKMTK